MSDQTSDQRMPTRKSRLRPRGSRTRFSRPHYVLKLFSRLLAFWDAFRRPILVAIIAISLAGLLASLSPHTRRALFTGFFEQRSLVLLLLGFNLITLSLLWSSGQRLDTSIYLMFNLRGYHPLWLDRVMWAFTQLGNGFVGLLLAASFYYLDQRRLAVELLLGILTLWLAVEIIKAIIERARPFITLETSRVIGWRERGKSFPSGHSSQAFFMVTLLAHHFNTGPLLSAVLYGLAVVVGFTRIYVGAHYPRDVIGGAILGSVWGLMTSLIEAYLMTGQF